MEQELIAYLDRHFSEINKKFDEVNKQFAEVNQQFGEVNKQFGEVNQRFDRVDQRFETVNQQIQELREESRHTRVLVEDLRDDVRLLAEVVDNNDEKTERRFEALETALARESAETRGLIKMSYADLDRRVSALEAKAS